MQLKGMAWQEYCFFIYHHLGVFMKKLALIILAVNFYSLSYAKVNYSASSFYNTQWTGKDANAAEVNLTIDADGNWSATNLDESSSVVTSNGSQISIENNAILLKQDSGDIRLTILPAESGLSLKISSVILAR